MVDNIIRSGEKAGTLDDIPDKTANVHVEEVKTELQTMKSRQGQAMIVIITVIVGLIVMSMYIDAKNEKNNS